MSISRKLMLILGLLVFTSIITFITIKYFEEKQKDDGAIIDAAGRNRMLSQKIGFYSEMIVKGDESAKSTLKNAIQLHDQSLTALKKGGVAPGISNNRTLPASEGYALSTVKSAENLWSDYKFNAEIIASEQTFINGKINPRVDNAIKFIEINSPEMLNRNNQIVIEYDQIYDQKIRQLNIVLTILLGVSLLFLLFGYFVAQSISKPIKSLVNAGNKIANGELETKIPEFNSNDELKDLSSTINMLTNALKFMKEESDKSVKNKENNKR